METSRIIRSRVGPSGRISASVAVEGTLNPFNGGAGGRMFRAKSLQAGDFEAKLLHLNFFRPTVH